MSAHRNDPVQETVLFYLISDAQKKLVAARKSGCPQDIHAEIRELEDAFAGLHGQVRAGMPDSVAFHRLHTRCRHLYARMGGLLTAAHWQSPAFGYSVTDETGGEQKIIRANINDYKRDQHPTGVAWEKKFASGYIGRGRPFVYATNSGMAALTVSALLVRQGLPRVYRIAVGKRSYFENKELLHMMFPRERIVFFDEQLPEELGSIRPHAVFADAVTNDPSMITTDFDAVVSASCTAGHPVTVVADVTCVSSLYFRMPKLPRLHTRVTFIGFESLNKFHQYGLDRVTGGVLWGYGVSSDAVYRVRDHAGVNIAEYAAAVLPTPNKYVLGTYLRRLEDNAAIVAKRLRGRVPGSVSVQYPGKPRGSKRALYAGSFVAVSMQNKDWRAYRTTLREILARAKKTGIPLVAGTSFGLPVTRIYTWTPRSRFEKVFLRISPGLESSQRMRELADCIADALVR